MKKNKVTIIALSIILVLLIGIKLLVPAENAYMNNYVVVTEATEIQDVHIEALGVNVVHPSFGKCSNGATAIGTFDGVVLHTSGHAILPSPEGYNNVSFVTPLHECSKPERFCKVCADFNSRTINKTDRWLNDGAAVPIWNKPAELSDHFFALIYNEKTESVEMFTAEMITQSNVFARFKMMDNDGWEREALLGDSGTIIYKITENGYVYASHIVYARDAGRYVARPFRDYVEISEMVTSNVTVEDLLQVSSSLK